MSASTFAADLQRFSVLVRGRSREVLQGVAEGVHRSITEGSALTGAPGQPVDTGYLHNSWQLVFGLGMTEATIGTPASYAPVIEYGLRTAFDPRGTTGRYGVAGGSIGPALAGRSRRPIKSTVGGQGSVRLTVANADAIQRAVVERATR